jgi:glycosyltransferase involved in cell wall biosynthesis
MLSSSQIRKSTGGNPLAAVRRIAIVGPSLASLVHARAGLIQALVERRHAVACFAPDIPLDPPEALSALGATAQALPVKADGFAFFADRTQVAALTAQLVELRPHAVLVYGQDTGLLGARAARKVRGARIIALVNGLPAVTKAGTHVVGHVNAASEIGRLLALADMAVFHNLDDQRTLVRSGGLPGDLPHMIVAGAGVDLAHYAQMPLPPLGAGLGFLTISRLDREKGVLDYCEAARALKARAPAARFELAGPPGTGKTGLPVSAVAAFSDCVDYIGPLDDVRPAIAKCHVYVFPSHAEGMPLSVLEAMAAGRPIITTSVAGCRDTVDDRVNGCLVGPGDPVALAAAMETFLKRPDLIPPTARASRAKAERLFDQRAVNDALVAVLEKER